MFYAREKYVVLARVGPVIHMSAFERHIATECIGKFKYIMHYLRFKCILLDFIALLRVKFVLLDFNALSRI